MTDIVTIARPYAEAAFRLALEKARLEHWSQMLKLIETVVGTEAMTGHIGDPNIDADGLENVILGVIGDSLDGEGRNLVQLLSRNGRLALAPHIRAQYEDLRRKHAGVLDAMVFSALPIADHQLQLLVAALEAKFGGKVTAHVEIDPELIGGARIVVGDKVIDATVRGRLEAMAAALTH